MEENEFGKYLKELREEKSYSTHTLAQLAGVSQSYISHVESGRKKNVPSPEILKKMAGPLGVSYEELMVKAGYWRSEYSKGDREFFEDIYNDEWDLNNKISQILKSIADGENIFPDYLHEDLFNIFGFCLPDHTHSGEHYAFDEWYSKFIKKGENEKTDSDIQEAVNEFNKFYNFTTVKNGIIEYNGDKHREEFLNQLVELMTKHDLTVNIDTRYDKNGAIEHERLLQLSKVRLSITNKNKLSNAMDKGDWFQAYLINKEITNYINQMPEITYTGIPINDEEKKEILKFIDYTISKRIKE